MCPPTCPTVAKVATSPHLGAETSLALITMGATASAWEKRCCFKINVIVCHRKPIWLLFLLSCTHLTSRTGVYLRMWFPFSLPSEGENGHHAFSSLLSHTLGKVKMGVVYSKHLAIFGRQSVCPHQTIDWVSLRLQQQQQQRLRNGQGRGRRTTPLIVVTSVFAQPDSESEELLKCGVKLFWCLQELAIMTVSFHISCVYGCGRIVHVHVCAHG